MSEILLVKRDISAKTKGYTKTLQERTLIRTFVAIYTDQVLLVFNHASLQEVKIIATDRQTYACRSTA